MRSSSERPAMNGESVVADVLLGTNGVKVHRQGMQHKYSTATVEEDKEEDDRLLTLPEADSARHSRERSPSKHHHHHHRNKHRSFSTPRTTNPHEGGGGTWSLGRNSAPAAKPKKPKRYLGSASTSLTSIPNAIKLSMLNSGLLSVGEIIFFMFKKGIRIRS